jgi:hypothetical protein
MSHEKGKAGSIRSEQLDERTLAASSGKVSGRMSGKHDGRRQQNRRRRTGNRGSHNRHLQVHPIKSGRAGGEQRTNPLAIEPSNDLSAGRNTAASLQLVATPCSHDDVCPTIVARE